MFGRIINLARGFVAKSHKPETPLVLSESAIKAPAKDPETERLVREEVNRMRQWMHMELNSPQTKVVEIKRM